MTIAETLLPEFDREMGVTRRLLERVPDGQFAWKPHDKSMTLGRLVEHLAQLPGWAKVTIRERSSDMVTGQLTDANSPATRAAVLQLFDAGVAEARAALTGTSDAELLAPWTLKAQGKEVFTMPKAVVLRSFVMNHMVHHRGQLSVYLRMHNVALPSIYGPSGDEAL
ncbi:MAG TPA: DinB family protein [Vicinamibacterales bacterium]|nr:DinB family protein [Vicinamibacterales bacterium]